MSENKNELNVNELEKAAGGAASRYIVYTVVKGDTLGRIANAYGVTVKDLPELTEAELSEGAAFANKYCAVTITKPGAIPSYPSLQEFKNIYK